MADPLFQALQDSILRICEQVAEGVSDQDICRKLEGDVKPQLRIKAYNVLLKSGRLVLEKKQVNGAMTVLYKWRSAKEAEKFRGLDGTETMVYQFIKTAGQSGLTKRDLKIRTNIQNGSELKQVVETLISRGMVKEIKSVQGANRRVYIVSELEPSVMHTGGPWYNDDQELDMEFIEAIYGQVRAYMETMEYVTVEQVSNYVAEIKLSNEDLAHNDIRALMTTMLYDATIEECEGAGDGGEYFRLAPATPAVNHLSSIPCGSCPLFKDCTPGGVISPQTCVYMTEWLKETADW